MNRARVSAELPPELIAWLVGADVRTWRHVARDAAAFAAIRLLTGEGEAAWNHVVHGLLLRDASPCVRAVAADLGTGPTTKALWSRGAIVEAVCEYLSLRGAGAWRDVMGRVKKLHGISTSAPSTAPSWS